MNFSGSYVALVTPFTDNGEKVDYTRLEELIEMQIAGGTAGITPAGCTGEAATLSHEEQKAVIKFTIEKVKGRCQVIAGTGSNNTAEALGLTRFAKEAGADAAMVITPYYNKPTAEGQYRHYRLLAEQTGLPIMLYNVPGRTGTKIEPETIARLRRDVPGIVAIKEACGSLDQVSAILSQCDIQVLSGDDSLTLPMMAVGGKGVVSVAANILPAEVAALCAAANRGDFAEARKLHYRLLPVLKALFIETNPIPVKTALKLMGRVNGVLRMPMCELRPENEEKLRVALRAAGVPGVK